MPARRDETGKRARQGSLVAQRRAQKQNRIGRHRSKGQQHHRNLMDIVDLPEQGELTGRLPIPDGGGVAAAVRGAAGAAHREGRRCRGAAPEWGGQV